MNYKRAIRAALMVAVGFLVMPAAVADVSTDFENLAPGTCIDSLCEFEGLPGVRFLSPNVASPGRRMFGEATLGRSAM